MAGTVVTGAWHTPPEPLPGRSAGGTSLPIVGGPSARHRSSEVTRPRPSWVQVHGPAVGAAHGDGSCGPRSRPPSIHRPGPPTAPTARGRRPSVSPLAEVTGVGARPPGVGRAVQRRQPGAPPRRSRRRPRWMPEPWPPQPGPPARRGWAAQPVGRRPPSRPVTPGHDADDQHHHRHQDRHHRDRSQLHRLASQRSDPADPRSSTPFRRRGRLRGSRSAPEGSGPELSPRSRRGRPGPRPRGPVRRPPPNDCPRGEHLTTGQGQGGVVRVVAAGHGQQVDLAQWRTRRGRSRPSRWRRRTWRRVRWRCRGRWWTGRACGPRAGRPGARGWSRRGRWRSWPVTTELRDSASTAPRRTTSSEPNGWLPPARDSAPGRGPGAGGPRPRRSRARPERSRPVRGAAVPSCGHAQRLVHDRDRRPRRGRPGRFWRAVLDYQVLYEADDEVVIGQGRAHLARPGVRAGARGQDGEEPAAHRPEAPTTATPRSSASWGSAPPGPTWARPARRPGSCWPTPRATSSACSAPEPADAPGTDPASARPRRARARAVDGSSPARPTR